MNSNDLSLALSLAIAALNKGSEIMALVNKMASENRTTLTAEEWGAILADDDLARARLAAAVAAAK